MSSRLCCAMIATPRSRSRMQRWRWVRAYLDRRFGSTVNQANVKFSARFIEPMLCAPAKELPEGPAWEYELKLDGYRALGLKSGGHPRLFSRNGKDFSIRFPSVTRALDALPDETLIDGEVVAKMAACKWLKRRNVVAI